MNKNVCVVDMNRQKLQQIMDIDFLFSVITCFVEFGECWNIYKTRYNTGKGFALLRRIILLFIHNKPVA
jgi:hypothetical protein